MLTLILKAAEVFRPEAFPEKTYVSRKSSTLICSYEMRLAQALQYPGLLIVLTGPAKTGKKTLCEKVIGREHIIKMSGSDFKEDTDLWELLAKKAGVPVQGIFCKDTVIDYYKKNDLVLLIDDFHYAPDPVKLVLAQQLKDAIRKEFKAVVVSLPHRQDEAIRQNADLSGRLTLINLDPWNVHDLAEIAKKGFQQLNISISDSTADKIACESLTSPQLMQYICLNICVCMENQVSLADTVDEDILPEVYSMTTANFDYSPVLKAMKSGPSTRGTRRKKFTGKDGNLYDLYELIVQAMAKAPPKTVMEAVDIKTRIYDLIEKDSEKPAIASIHSSIKRISEVLADKKDEIFHVIDWKDNTIYILDLLFLFYLRWGKA